MPTRNTPWPAGTPCWTDVAVPDVSAACTFYSELFGWDAAPGAPAAGGYASARLRGHRVAGIGPVGGGSAEPTWTTYIATDDAAASCRAVLAAGGRVVEEPVAMGPLGTGAVAADPTGARFGLWQAGEHPGVELFSEHGGMLWNEAAVSDPVVARAFYSAVFGWEWDEVDGATGYQAFRLGERWLGGLGPVGDSSVGGWGTCFAATSTDDVVAGVLARGGRVLVPAQDSPYGRLAVVADPQGAPFSVMQVAEPG